MARTVDGRQGNNTDGQGCKDIEAEWKNFNTSGDKAVPGVDGDVDPDETKKTISSLDNLNNRHAQQHSLRIFRYDVPSMQENPGDRLGLLCEGGLSPGHRDSHYCEDKVEEERELQNI